MGQHRFQIHFAVPATLSDKKCGKNVFFLKTVLKSCCGVLYSTASNENLTETLTKTRDTLQKNETLPERTEPGRTSRQL